jgi:hypothetical protein
VTAPRQRPTHACPGCGKRQVPRHQLSCRPCWYRLPRDLRDRINDAYRRDRTEHMYAIADAAEWYRQNPAVRA